MNSGLTRSLRSGSILAAVAALLLGAFAAPPARARSTARAYSDQLDRAFTRYDFATIDPTEIVRSVRSRGRATIRTTRERFDLELSPKDLRAPSYRAEETFPNGETRTLPAPEINTYAGIVRNRGGAAARFTIDESEISGMILDGDERVFVEPLENYTLGGGPTDYVVYRGSDVRPDYMPGTCGATEAGRVEDALQGVSAKADTATTSALSVVQLATETDNLYVSALGSAGAANSEILGIVNQVDGVYTAEVGLTFQVVLQNSYAGTDPYSTTTSPSTLLSELRTYWNANKSGVVRDVTHMWTGRDMDGSTIGIAYVGVVCANPSYSYGISQRYTTSPQKYILTAHEIGHNFGACHSDSACNPSTGTCTNTVMQSVIGSGFTFCAFSRGQITGFVTSNSSCLGAAAAPPAAPSSLAATAVSSSQINLSWSDLSSDETGFKVERSLGTTGSWTQVALTGPDTTTYSDAGLSASTSYSYRVRATDAGGDSAYTNVATAATLASAALPAAPSNLKATPVSSSRIELDWSDNSGNETGFRIERSRDGVNFAQLATVGTNVATYTDVNALWRVTYYYRVRAYNAGGNSAYSNTVVAVTH